MNIMNHASAISLTSCSSVRLQVRIASATPKTGAENRPISFVLHRQMVLELIKPNKQFAVVGPGSKAFDNKERIR